MLEFFYKYGGFMGSCMPMKKEDTDDEDDDLHFLNKNVHIIKSKENWDERLLEAKKEGKMVVANFSASWCGPCRALAPFYGELSEKFPSLMFVMIDVDEMSEFSSSWDIRATPTFFFVKNGEQIDKLVGASKPDLENKIAMMADSV